MSDFPTIPPQPSEDGQPGLHVQMVGFERSEELAGVAHGLISAHSRLGFLEVFELGYLLDHAEPPEKPHDVVRVGVVGSWQRALTTFDGAVIVNAPVWSAINERQQEAMVLHGLLHFGQNEKSGKLITMPHDVEEFTFVVREYGAWRPSLRDMHEQLSLGLQRGQ